MDGIEARYDKIKSVEVKPGSVVITVEDSDETEISISRDAVARIAREMGLALKPPVEIQNDHDGDKGFAPLVN